MLYFFKSDDSLGQFIEEKLKEMSAASKIISIDGGESYLSEYERDLRGPDEVKKFLEQYAEQLRGQHMVSADACYTDPISGDSGCVI